MREVFFDNNLIRKLVDDPSNWNVIYDQLVPLIGRRYHALQSTYLFLEYIGFHKSQITISPELTKIEFSPSITGRKSEDLVVHFGKAIDSKLKLIDSELKEQLANLKFHFENKISERRAYVTKWHGSDELINNLFGELIALLEQDYNSFVDELVYALAWDLVCCIEVKDISRSKLRQFQIGQWLHLYEEGFTLPMGKLIDDVNNHFDMQFTSTFKNKEDMVDSELISYAVLGKRGEERRLPVTCLTLDSPEEVKERMRLALGTISNIEEVTGRNLNVRSGVVYCLDHSNCQILEIVEPGLIIRL